jgi:hypothetical protein
MQRKETCCFTSAASASPATAADAHGSPTRGPSHRQMTRAGCAFCAPAVASNCRSSASNRRWHETNPLRVLMESRMRGNSQVRIGGRRRGDHRARRPALAPRRRPCVSSGSQGLDYANLEQTVIEHQKTSLGRIATLHVARRSFESRLCRRPVCISGSSNWHRHALYSVGCDELLWRARNLPPQLAPERLLNRGRASPSSSAVLTSDPARAVCLVVLC